MRFFAERMKMIVEPTGCLAAAALLEGAIDLRGQRVGVILSGGNVDLARYAALLQAAGLSTRRRSIPHYRRTHGRSRFHCPSPAAADTSEADKRSREQVDKRLAQSAAVSHGRITLGGQSMDYLVHAAYVPVVASGFKGATVEPEAAIFTTAYMCKAVAGVTAAGVFCLQRRARFGFDLAAVRSARPQACADARRRQPAVCRRFVSSTTR